MTNLMQRKASALADIESRKTTACGTELQVINDCICRINAADRVIDVIVAVNMYYLNDLGC